MQGRRTRLLLLALSIGGRLLLFTGIRQVLAHGTEARQGSLAIEPWYDFLNLGYKILPMAG